MAASLLSVLSLNTSFKHTIVPFSLLLASLYHSSSRYFASSKQRAWILTTFTSFVMTCGSLPFAWDYIRHGYSVGAARNGWQGAVLLNRFFQAHLLADLAFGALCYREHVTLASGWIHHAVYVFIVEFAIRRGWADIFAFCALMELPTFVLGIGSLFPRLRSYTPAIFLTKSQSDSSFSSTSNSPSVLYTTIYTALFLTIRVFFHMAIIIGYFVPRNRLSLVNGSWAPVVLIGAALPMHILWGVSCVKGCVKRWKKALESAIPVEASKEVVETQVEVPTVQVHAQQSTVRIENPTSPLASSSRSPSCSPRRRNTYTTTERERSTSPIPELNLSKSAIIQRRRQKSVSSNSPSDERDLHSDDSALPVPIPSSLSMPVTVERPVRMMRFESGSSTTTTSTMPASSYSSSSSTSLSSSSTPLPNPSEHIDPLSLSLHLLNLPGSFPHSQLLASSPKSKIPSSSQSQTSGSPSCRTESARARARARAMQVAMTLYAALPDRKEVFEYVGLGHGAQQVQAQGLGGGNGVGQRAREASERLRARIGARIGFGGGMGVGSTVVPAVRAAA